MARCHPRRSDLDAVFGPAAAANTHYQAQAAIARRKQHKSLETRLAKMDARRWLSRRSARTCRMAGRIAQGGSLFPRRPGCDRRRSVCISSFADLAFEKGKTLEFVFIPSGG